MKHYLIAALLLTMFTIPTQAQKYNCAYIDPFCQKARELIQQGQYEQALSGLEEAMKDNGIKNCPDVYKIKDLISEIEKHQQNIVLEMIQNARDSIAQNQFLGASRILDTASSYGLYGDKILALRNEMKQKGISLSLEKYKQREYAQSIKYYEDVMGNDTTEALPYWIEDAKRMLTSSKKQTASSINTSVTQKPSRTTWYVRAGVALDWVTYSGKADVTDIIGYEAGVGFMRSLSSKNGGWWGVEAGLATRGFYVEKPEDDSYQAHHLYIQPSFGWNFDVANRIAITPHAGMFASYDLFGFADGAEIAEYDAGFNIGVGVWINKKVNIDIKYRKGLLNMDKSFFDGDRDVTSNKLVFSSAIAF